MASTDSQKQLFTLIRDFAAEKSQGEKRVFNLKKRIEELQSNVNAVNNELENTKRFKEIAEQDLKGYEVEFSMAETSIQTLEARIASIQDEISKVGSDVDALKNKEAALRDEFINQMLDFKSEIRNFQGSSNLSKRSGLRASSECNHVSREDAKVRDFEQKISYMVAQTAAEEEECGREQLLYNQLYQEMVDSGRKRDLVKMVMTDIKELQELTRLSSEMEEKCSTSSEELQRSCLCPNCHLDNTESLAELLQEMEHS
ncbi:uncharacterized protein LOC141611800 [Silene latifolia]|uniref:uncharacterized protein LOC141611800 n=1 Tax=Silene latifolia TaxID=37657 RepID=UPI003D777274